MATFPLFAWVANVKKNRYGELSGILKNCNWNLSPHTKYFKLCKRHSKNVAHVMFNFFSFFKSIIIFQAELEDFNNWLTFFQEFLFSAASA